MSDQRDGGIAWTDSTWNPVRGCTRVSEGCRNCYAERMAARFSGPGQPYDGLARMTEAGPRWTGKVRLVLEHLYDPLRWKRPRRIFVNSMSDLFHEALTDGEILRVFAVMARARQHVFQVLTKRPERMRAWTRRWMDLKGEADEPRLARGPAATRRAHPSGRGQMFAEMLESMGEPPAGAAYPTFDWMEGMRWWLQDPAAIWRNVWLGVSVEDQATADERIPLLMDTPAAIRFVSYEPALGPVDFTGLTAPDAVSGAKRGHATFDVVGGSAVYPTGDPECSEQGYPIPRLDWIIAGGESGPGARPMHPDWVASTVRQCREAGVACFVKQLGAWRAMLWGGTPTAKDGNWGTLDAGGKFWKGTTPWNGKQLDDSDTREVVIVSVGGHQSDPAEWPEDLRVREFPTGHDQEAHE